MLMAKAGKYDGYLLEGMACPGGCVAGAGTLLPIDAAQRQVAAYQKVADSTSPESSPHREKAQHLNELYRPVSDPT